MLTNHASAEEVYSSNLRKPYSILVYISELMNPIYPVLEMLS